MQRLYSLVDQYRANLIAVERKSALSVETYIGELKFFMLWLEQSGLNFKTLDGENLNTYLSLRREEGVNARTLSKIISVLRSFFRFLIEEGLRENNPAMALERPRQEQRLPQVLSQEEIEALFSHIKTDNPLGIRDRALYELLYSSGLRVSEAVALDIGDVDFKEALVLLHGKGSRERLVPFGSYAEKWLKRYLNEARPALVKPHSKNAFFLTRVGKRLGRKGIWKNYSQLCGQTGASSRLHTLRHSFATELLQGGLDMRSVQSLLGHSDLVTTQIYTHVNPSHLRKAHAAGIPRLLEEKDRKEGENEKTG